MPFRPFKLLSESERARIAAHSADALDAWRQAWVTGAARGASNVTCEPAWQCDGLFAATQWYTLSANGATIFVADRERAFETVRSLLASAASDGGRSDQRAPAAGDTLAAKIVHKAMHELGEKLLGFAAAESKQAPPDELWRRGSGAACVTLPLPSTQGEIMAVFDSAATSRLIDATKRSAAQLPPLVHPQQCVGREAVEITVWLGSAEIELASLQSLAVNDVLLLDSRIDRALRVSVAGREVAPRAVLGRAGSHKAVRLTTYAAGD